MTAAHDRPSPGELLEAVTEFLAGPPGDVDRDRLHRRVAANVLGIVSRELAAQPQDDAAHAARLARLGVPDNEALAHLAATCDDPTQTADLSDALWAWTQAKVRVVNPSYLEDA